MIHVDATADPTEGTIPTIRRSLMDAVCVTAVSCFAALVFNAVRPDGLPVVATTPYQVLVPCPEPGGPVQEMAAGDPALGEVRTFFVDARSLEEYQARHLPGAVNLPYDWLDPVSEDRLLALALEIAGSGATRVVVYGDGGRPDSGEHLGREISGRGIKNVYFISGGAPAALTEEAP